MLIPYNTDAPIYHWPVATVGLIATNVVVFFGMMGASPDQIEPWILHWGQGWNPLQWVSSIFMHAGIGHLLGNMFCLWGFGLIVEGKIGWWRFLAVYLGIGVGQSMIEQTMMLGATTGGSLGASAAIFGILAIALIWAPANEFNCMFIVFIGLMFRVFYFECAVRTLATIALVLDLLILMVTVLATGSLAQSVGTAMLHLMGAALGLVVGVVMLRKGWVDCENWDIFSIWAGRNRSETVDVDALRASSPPELPGELVRQRRLAAAVQIREILGDGRAVLAYRAHQKMQRTLPGWQLPEREFLQLISGLCQQEQWSEAVLAMVEYLRTYHRRALEVRLKLALILVEKEGRPVQALRVLAKIQAETLTSKQRELYLRLQRKAERLARDNPYEVAADDW